MKTYRTQIEVRGYELDSFGHVNHANYLGYLEHARWRMLAEEGITLPKLQVLKRWPVIAQMELKYLKPTFMGDLLEVETRCVDHSKIGFTFEQIIKKGDLIVMKATVRGVMVNENGRPADYPPELEGLWQ
jgi:acyl-CoA thioester hydrolase